MKFSVCVDAVYAGMPFKAALEEIKRAGLSAFEFWSWWDKDVDEIAAVSQNLGLQAAAFCTKMPPLTDRGRQEEFLAGLQESIEIAKKLNCDTLITQVGQEFAGVSRREQMENIMDGLKQSVPLLEKAEITLVFEPLNTKVDHKGYFLSTTEEAVQICDTVDSKWVKILFDYYHQQISEGDVLRNSIENLPRIGHFHAAGNPGRNELHRGEMNYEGIFETLAQTAYQGFVGLEYFPKEDRFVGLVKLAELEKKLF